MYTFHAIDWPLPGETEPRFLLSHELHEAAISCAVTKSRRKNNFVQSFLEENKAMHVVRSLQDITKDPEHAADGVIAYERGRNQRVCVVGAAVIHHSITAIAHPLRGTVSSPIEQPITIINGWVRARDATSLKHLYSDLRRELVSDEEVAVAMEPCSSKPEVHAALRECFGSEWIGRISVAGAAKVSVPVVLYGLENNPFSVFDNPSSNMRH